MSEQSSLELAIAGDLSAVSTLIDQLRPRVGRMAAYYARCSGMDSDDLLQEAWIGLLEALPGLDISIGQPDQYLVCRARWRLLDAIRRAKSRPLELVDFQPNDAVDASRVDKCLAGRVSGTGVETALSGVMLAQFLRQLDTTQQRIVGCLMDGLTWRETAAALGCSSPNIAYHVRRVRARYEAWSGESDGFS